MSFVVDASFLAWTIHEPADASSQDRIQFRLYLSGQTMIGPNHLPYELGNALRKKWLVAEPLLRAALHSDLMEGVDLEALQGDTVARIHDLADQYAITFYDAAYLAAAMAKPDRILVTQDRKLRDAGIRALGKRRCLDGDGVLALHREGGKPL